MVRILNVAEKPSIAKAISQILSGQRFQRRAGFSKYNHCYDFPCSFGIAGRFTEENVNMTMTSVSGHLMEIEFKKNLRNWRGTDIRSLFREEIAQSVSSGNNCDKIARTLKREARNSQYLIIWTDCDREGEAIGKEIARTCVAVNPSVVVKRARFSCVNDQDVWNALRNLVELNEGEVNAVEARQEIDLRLGAVFTRFQTLRLQDRFIELDGKVVSFGPCQFPTLGFVVRRFEEIQDFIEEPFWSINLSYTADDQVLGNMAPTTSGERNASPERERCDFQWQRQRLFDYVSAFGIFEMCHEAPLATVVDVKRKPKSKWRPLPLATVELQIRMSKFLRMSSEVTMNTAEKLYQKGILSYPRTETDIFAQSFDLRGMVAQFQNGPDPWNRYAGMLLHENRFQWPRSGRKNDEAHPPIHPTKCVPLDTLASREEKLVYEFVVRHFLACCSWDAKGHESSIDVEVAGENFNVKGLIIQEKNYLDVYTYERWGEKTLPKLEVGQTFIPSRLELSEGKTRPPELLSEVDLIKLMDKHGIGTDATIQDHIKTILQREYAQKLPHKQNRFAPTKLGHGLVKCYKDIGHEESISLPMTRAGMEKDLGLICQGVKTKSQVVNEIIQKFEVVYDDTKRNINKFYSTLGQHFQANIDYEGDDGGDGGDDHGSGGNGIATRAPRRNNTMHERYRVFRRGFSYCGMCNQKSLDLRQLNLNNNNSNNATNSNMNMRRILRCDSCDVTLKLPNGVPTPFEHSCPLCGFQVLEVMNPKTKKKYKLCPKCYSSGGAGRNENRNSGNTIGEIEDAGAASGSFHTGTMPCWKCCEPSCKLAQGVQGGDVEVCICPECKNEKMVLKKSKAGNYYLGCPGYPQCNGAIWLPKAAKTVSVPDNGTGRVCSTCADTRLLDFDFDHRSILSGMPSRMTACPNPGCKSQCNDYSRILEMSTFNSSSARQLPAANCLQNSSTRNSHPRSAQPLGIPGQQGSLNVNSYGNQRENSQVTRVPQSSVSYGSSTSNTNVVNTSVVNNNNRNRAEEGLPMCNHGEICVARIVNKEGPNKGRQFFVCGRARDQQCDIFIWADENIGDQGHINGLSNNNGKNSNSGSNSSSVVPQCEHGEVCGLRTVNKDGPNKGRQFYVCNRPREQQCKVFIWADEQNGLSTHSSTNYSQIGNYASNGPANGMLSSSNSGIDSNGVAPQCEHGEVCGIRTVNKDGPNKGRQFYVCNRPRDQQCKIFIWADEQNGSTNLSSFTTSNQEQRCFKCNNTGHYASQCPSGAIGNNSGYILNAQKSHNNTNVQNPGAKCKKRFCPKCGHELGYRKRKCGNCK